MSAIVRLAHFFARCRSCVFVVELSGEGWETRPMRRGVPVAAGALLVAAFGSGLAGGVIAVWGAEGSTAGWKIRVGSQRGL